MKTPKPVKEKQTIVKSAGGKITKNKGKGKNPAGAQVDAVKAKLGLQKAKETVKVQDGKKLQKKPDMKVLNGNVSPVNGAGKKRKPAGKKGKGPASSAEKSPEVQLGLKIEKMLESPKGNKKNKKGKKNAAITAGSPEVQTPVAGSPGKGKKKNRKRKNSEGSSPVAAKPAGNQQKKIKNPAAPRPQGEKPQHDAPVPMGSFPSRVNAENAIKALLKHMKEHKAKKPALLDEFEPLMVNVDFFKKPEGARRIQRVLLPHPYLGNNPDIVFVAIDDKKAKKDFDEAIEKHKEIFSSHGVDNIAEIIPWRKLCSEYTQFEEKRKLANRADAFLIDSKLSHRWPAIMRKKFFRKKAPIPVRVDKTNDLKKNVETALRKVAVLLGKLNTLSVSPLFGNSKMNVKSLSDNLITIATVLCDQTKYPGGQGNIRQITIKGEKTEGFPVFVSTASPNTAVIPKVNQKKKRAVEGEVTTAGVTVRVHPGGQVQVVSKDQDEEMEGDSSPKKKKQKAVKMEESEDDDSEFDDDEEDDDSEIDADLLEKFKKANKASEDESSEDEEEIEKAEQEFLLALRKQQDALESEAQAKSKKAGKKTPAVKAESSDDDDEEDDDDGEDDDDDSDVPDLVPSKKTKPQAQPAKKGKNAKQAPKGGKPTQNGVGKGKPGKQAQSPKGAGAKKGFQGGKGNKKGSPKAQQKFANKGGKKK